MNNYTEIYSIAADAMQLEKLRMDVVANNIANQHALAEVGGTLFQAKEVITRASSFEEMISDERSLGFKSVKVLPQNLPPNKVYQPGHPAADEQGYVTYPGISMVDEMATMLRASRAYEANIRIINSANHLYLQALKIGEQT